MTGKVEVRCRAVGDFAKLSRDLQRVGAGALRKELYKGLQRAARPAIAAARERAESSLPSGGGRGRRRTRMVATGRTITNQVSGRTHAVKERRKGGMAGGESVAQRVAGARFSVRMAGGSGSPRIRITASTRQGHSIDLARLDEGKLRHPLFGNRKHWYEQAVPPKWFTGPLEASAGEFAKGLETAVDAVKKEIEGG